MSSLGIERNHISRSGTIALAVVLIAAGLLDACAPIVPNQPTAQPTATIRSKAEQGASVAKTEPTTAAAAAKPASTATANKTPVPKPSSTPTKAAPASTSTAAVAGAATVYFFFSTRCEYCAAQASEMEQFHHENPIAQVVGVPLYASQSDAQNFARRYGLTFEVRQDSALVNALGSVSKHPVIALQSLSNGTLVRASNGTISVSSLRSSYDAFVKGGQPITKSGSG